jgi:NADH-quinone oxidoreductase subunit E
MKDSTRNDNDVLTVVRDVIAHHGSSATELIPILSEVNQKLGYLPTAAMAEISRQVRVSDSQVFSVASFYHMLSTKPRGKHVIKFCESAPCHVVGGREVWATLKDQLGIESGETTGDGKWTLITTSCLGICAVGPVMMIDDEVYGNVEPDQVSEILAQYD